MKKALLITSIAIALSGCGSDTDLVKGGTMKFNKTTTLGQALDTWKSCKENSWNDFKTESGMRVVEFSCAHKISAYMEKAKNLLPKEKQAEADQLDITSLTHTFQFTLNQDDSFQINNVQSETVWADGKSLTDSVKAMDQLKAAYSNDLLFNPSEINSNRSAHQLSSVFSMLKEGAK